VSGRIRFDEFVEVQTPVAERATAPASRLATAMEISTLITNS
jgi:hypothetical protein